MTKKRDLKALVRERMEKTGESFMSARKALLEAQATTRSKTWAELKAERFTPEELARIDAEVSEEVKLLEARERIECIFCFKTFDWLRDLKAHSAECPEHPAVKALKAVAKAEELMEVAPANKGVVTIPFVVGGKPQIITVSPFEQELMEEVKEITERVVAVHEAEKPVPRELISDKLAAEIRAREEADEKAGKKVEFDYAAHARANGCICPDANHGTNMECPYHHAKVITEPTVIEPVVPPARGGLSEEGTVDVAKMLYDKHFGDHKAKLELLARDIDAELRERKIDAATAQQLRWQQENVQRQLAKANAGPVKLSEIGPDEVDPRRDPSYVSLGDFRRTPAPNNGEVLFCDCGASIWFDRWNDKLASWSKEHYPHLKRRLSELDLFGGTKRAEKTLEELSDFAHTGGVLRVDVGDVPPEEAIKLIERTKSEFNKRMKEAEFAKRIAIDGSYVVLQGGTDTDKLTLMLTRGEFDSWLHSHWKAHIVEHAQDHGLLEEGEARYSWHLVLLNGNWKPLELTALRPLEMPVRREFTEIYVDDPDKHQEAPFDGQLEVGDRVEVFLSPYGSQKLTVQLVKGLRAQVSNERHLIDIERKEGGWYFGRRTVQVVSGAYKRKSCGHIGEATHCEVCRAARSEIINTGPLKRETIENWVGRDTDGRPTCCEQYGEAVPSSVEEGTWVHPSTPVGRILCRVKHPNHIDEQRAARAKERTVEDDLIEDAMLRAAKKTDADALRHLFSGDYADPPPSKGPGKIIYDAVARPGKPVREPTAAELYSDDPNHEEDTACSCGQPDKLGPGAKIIDDDPDCLYHHPYTSEDSTFADAEVPAPWRVKREQRRQRDDGAPKLLDDALKTHIREFLASQTAQGISATDAAASLKVERRFVMEVMREMFGEQADRAWDDLERRRSGKPPANDFPESYGRCWNCHGAYPIWANKSRTCVHCGHNPVEVIRVCRECGGRMRDDELGIEHRECPDVSGMPADFDDGVRPRIKCLVNGTERELPRMAGYRDVLIAAGYDPERVISVAYSFRSGGGFGTRKVPRHAGTMHAGSGLVEVLPCMVINAMDTGSA